MLDRIAVVTPLFPIRQEPFRGQPIYLTVRELAKLVRVKVFCPQARYPNSRRLQPRNYVYYPPASYHPEGVEACYFAYPALPAVSRPLNGWMCERMLRPLVSAWKPDAILSYWLYPEGWSAVLTAERLGVPVIVGTRGSDLSAGMDGLAKFQTSRVLHRANGVLAVSNELKRQAVAWGVPAGKVKVVVNGCDPSIFHPRDRQMERKRWNVSPEAEVVVFVGHLVAGKGVRELVEAVEKLAGRRPRLEVALIGDGNLESDLRHQAERRGVQDRVRFVGRANAADIGSWLGACNVFTLPSYSEGCPNVVIEALACGRPVVAANVGGIPDLVSDGTGILIPPRDSGALASALDKALSESWDEAKIAGGWARGWGQVAGETLDFCEQIASAAHG